MQTAQPNIFMRDDTFLGVCQALGEDFGFNPLYLRVALAVSLLLNPAAVIGTYAALGAAVLISRVIAPNRRWALPKMPKLPRLRRAGAPAVAEAMAGEPAAAHELTAGDNEDLELAAAA